MTKTIQLPTFDFYCDNTTKGNAIVFDLGSLRVWFSYHTPIAFKLLGFPIIVHENDWSVTTGKHLNAIDRDKKSRVSSEVFAELIDLAQTDRTVKLRQRLVDLGKMELGE